MRYGQLHGPWISSTREEVRTGQHFIQHTPLSAPFTHPSFAELLIPEDEPSEAHGCTRTNMTRYRHRNKLLHEEMMRSSFPSIMHGNKVEFDELGNLKAVYGIFQVEEGNYIPYDDTLWDPCNGPKDPKPYEPRTVATITSGCTHVSCVDLAFDFTFMDGTTQPPPAIRNAITVKEIEGSVEPRTYAFIGAVVFIALGVALYFYKSQAVQIKRKESAIGQLRSVKKAHSTMRKSMKRQHSTLRKQVRLYKN